MKILTVDDDPILREALSDCVLEEGFDSVEAANGIEAIEVFERENPDLVCLDIMMPLSDGYETCKNIRMLNSSIPILFLSAKNEERDIVKGLNLGADDFIRKPFTKDEVMARIRAVLRRTAHLHTNSSFFMMGQTKVIPNQLLAETTKGEIELSAREIKILTVLYRNANTPVSRDTLLDECWGIDYFPDSRTLDQHILVLRKKIEETPSNPKIIKSVRSVGYVYHDDAKNNA